MGKWSPATIQEGFKERFEELKDMTYSAIDDLWIYYGSLSLDSFSNMEWYWSQTTDWACIDNCEGKGAPANFKVFCSFSDYNNDGKRVRFEKLCICLAVEFNIPRKAIVTEPTPQKKPNENILNMLVKGTINIPSLQLHIFKGRYDNVIAFLCANEEHAKVIISSFIESDSKRDEIGEYLYNSHWFPIVYADNAMAALDAIIEHINKPFVERDVNKWVKAVERATSDFLCSNHSKELQADLDTYMENHENVYSKEID